MDKYHVDLTDHEECFQIEKLMISHFDDAG